MTDKELRKLKRADLLRIMVAQSKEIDRLKKELEAAKEAVASRELLLGKAGSIAEASLALYEVIERTQKAADLYLENIKRMSGESGASLSAGYGRNESGTEGKV